MHKNTKGSGGPQTSSGKAIVSKNAMKSGVYSTVRLLPDESPMEYENVKNSFWADLQPQDLIEETLVDDLVQLAWKKMRLDRFEEASLTAKLRAPIREDELASGSKLSAIGLEVARKIFAMDENERAEYLDAYRILQHLLTKPTLDRNDFSASNSYLMRALEDYLQERQIREMTGRKDPNELIEDLNARFKPSKVLDSSESRHLRRFVAHTLEAMHSQAGHLEHYEELLKEWQAVQDERYLSIMASGTITRAHDDLRRAFYKALQEFRKHRQWKLMNATIALPPTEP